MQNLEQIKPSNSIVPLWYELKTRFLAPVGQVSFWVFLFLGVILFSACGVWVELGKYGLSLSGNLDGVRTAIYTFFPALACTATMQIIFSQDDKKKYLRSAAYAIGVILMLVAIGLLAFDKQFSPTVSISWGTIASVISVLTWWVANGHENMFYDNQTDPEAQVGGSTNAPLNGNTSDYKTS